MFGIDISGIGLGGIILVAFIVYVAFNIGRQHEAADRLRAQEAEWEAAFRRDHPGFDQAYAAELLKVAPDWPASHKREVAYRKALDQRLVAGGGHPESWGPRQLRSKRDDPPYNPQAH